MKQCNILVFLSLFLFSGSSILFSAQTTNPERRFEFDYQVNIKNIPQSGQALAVWTPLAKTDDHQEVLGRQIELNYPYRIYKDPEYGNEILNIELGRSLPKEIRFQIHYWVRSKGGTEVSLSKEEIQKEHAGNDMEQSLEPYLKSNRLMVINNEIRQMAQDVTMDKKTVLEKARAIYDYVIHSMKYDKSVEGWGRGDTLRACRIGAGNCTDFHSLFISLARAVGIPSRFKIGAQIPDSNSEGQIGYHCWAEFLNDGNWIPVDASEAWKNPEKREYYFGGVDPNKFTLSLGRDILLTKGKEVNMLLYPYVEVDGQPFESVETTFYFKKDENKKEKLQ